MSALARDMQDTSCAARSMEEQAPSASRKGSAEASPGSKSDRQVTPEDRPAGIGAAAVLQTGASLLWLPQAGLIALAIGRIAAGERVEAVVFPALGLLALGLARAGLDAAGSRLAFKAARAVLTQKRAEVAAALAARSPLDINRPASGLAASALAEQAEAIVPYLARFRPARLKAVIVPGIILLCVLFFSWTAALVLFFSAPLIPIFMALIGWRAKAASEAQLKEVGGMNAFLLDRLRGLATIRSLGAVDATASRVRANAENLRSRTMAVLRIAFLSSAVLELFASLGVAMFAVYVGFHLLGDLNFGAWGTKLSLAEGLFILLLAPAFFEPLRDLSSVWHDKAAGQAALISLDELTGSGMRLPGSNREDSGANRSPTVPGVQLSGISFRHAGKAEPVFDGFDLDVAPGEHVALLGPSGCGKSTLLALVAGLAEPEAGSIEIGGEPLHAGTAVGLRRRTAWVGQAPHIFTGTIAGNVTLGRPDVSPDDVRHALQISSLDTVAKARGSALIGENGVGLSGGEALRLAVARAAAAPRAGLILADEPTAHLDTETASEIADALISLAVGRTLIIATHDPVLAARMDRIVRLEPQILEAVA